MKERIKNKRIELLAPAKDLTSGIAAVNHGADAVYIGAPKFGARFAAANSINDIERLASYAHRCWAKVYVALNTILYDNELEEAHALVRLIDQAGADALIIQDMGLLELDIPPIPLFASTQMHNYTVAKIQFLEKIGFQRVILAREISLKQLEEIRAQTTIDLECFIHGALCVSFSGQCYLSQATQGRSANRGECAQPCRLPYTLSDSNGLVLERNKHLLSLKDLNLSEYLRDLIDAGVSSFKIEGRLKDISYVKNVTSFYRQKIDEIMEKDTSLMRSSSGKTSVGFQPNPSKTFNRGFTDYFIRKRSKDILSPDTPKSIGEIMGRVKKAEHNSFILDTDENLHNGDGICFFDSKELLCGTNINKVEGRSIFPSEIEGIEAGTVIYRNYDHEFNKTLKADKTKRLINVNMQFEETENGFKLSLEDEDGIKISVVQKVKKTPAKNLTVAEETVRRQLSKLGDSIFWPEKINIIWSKPYFIPVKECNELRRKAIECLIQERVKKYKRNQKIIVPNSEPYLSSHLEYTANVSNNKAESFYHRHGVQTIERAFELKKKNIANVMTTKHCLRFQYGLCKGSNNVNAEQIFLHDAKHLYRLEFDCKACQMRIMLEKKTKKK